ncbi:MAG: TetR/AcrR family transcriptional regulator [Candidatus Acidiferrales bacterium]
MATRRHNGARLDRRDWVDAGIEILSSKGVDAVRVEALARRLNISKGSFYWHFKDRSDLLEAILEEWEARQSDWNTEGEGVSNPVERWARLFELLSQPSYARLETAISSWARQDEKVALRVASADRKRIAYLSRVFREIGFTTNQAAEWANAAMFLYLGWMDRMTRTAARESSEPALAELLSRFVLAASALASQEALQSR